MVNKILDKANRYRYSKAVFLIFKGNVISVMQLFLEVKMQTAHCLTVNWHFTAACNFECRYCFMHNSPSLKKEDYTAVLKKLEGSFKRINFVGGEPTASPLLIPLVRKAYHAGFDCSIVTNGFNLIHYPQHFTGIYPLLSCIGISVDSLYESTNAAIGRAVDAAKYQARYSA